MATVCALMSDHEVQPIIRLRVAATILRSLGSADPLLLKDLDWTDLNKIQRGEGDAFTLLGFLSL